MKFERSASARVRTPTVLQMNSSESGAASLSMILGYYEYFMPLEDLRAECGEARGVEEPERFAKAARLHGLDAEEVHHDLESLKSEAKKPCLLFWNGGHIVVFEGMKGDLYQINDPASGRRVIKKEELESAFNGVSLELRPAAGFQPHGTPGGLFRGVRDWFRGNETASIFVALCSVLSAIPGAAVPGLISAFINGVVVGQNASWSSWIVIGIIVMVLAQAVLYWLTMLAVSRIAYRMFVVQSTRMAEHMLCLPIRFFEHRSDGDLVARFGSNQFISQALGNWLLMGLAHFATAVIYGLTLLSFNFIIGVLTIVSIVMMFGGLRWTNVMLLDRNKALRQDVWRQYGTLMLLMRSLPEIKATSREAEAFSHWAGYQAKANNAQQEVSTVSTWLDAAPIFSSGLIMYVIVLTFGGYQVIEGDMSVGALVGMQMLAALLMMPVGQLMRLAQTLQRSQAEITRVLDVTDHDIDPTVKIDFGSSGDVANLDRLGGAIEWRDVTFGFDQTSDPIIKNLSFSIQPGSIVGIVGPSGSGKSTISSLMVGLEAPWEGEILFDALPREAIESVVLSRSIAGASGQVTAFGASLRDNVSMWDASISDERVINALEDAHCAELLDRTGGLDAEIAEGGRNLSGGQLQRLEIARALVRRPSILVLDGATSALDGETEARVLERLRQRGCTTILVTERKSSLRFMDEIIIVSEGDILDRGKHSVLLARNEWYRDEFGLRV